VGSQTCPSGSESEEQNFHSSPEKQITLYYKQSKVKREEFVIKNLNRTTYGASAQSKLDGLKIEGGHPALGNQTLLGNVQVEQVQCVVDGFYLAHLHEPVGDVLSCRSQHSVSVVLGLSKDGVEVLDAGHHAHGHLPPVRGGLGTGVQGGSETLADLLDAGLQLVSLEEDDEHALVHLVALKNKIQ